MANAAIKPSAETVCWLCRGGAVKTKGQWLIAKRKKYGKRGYKEFCTSY